MKKLLLSAAVLFTGTYMAQAQTGTFIGDKVSIGHSWTVGNHPSGYDRAFHTSYAAGRAATFRFSDNAGIGFGTFFSSEGYTYKNKKSDVNVNLRTNYIRIPVYADFNFGSGNCMVVPHMALGGSVGFLVGGRQLVLNDDAYYTNGVKAIKGMKTKVDAGLNASLGFSVKLGKGVIVNNDVNYYHGLVEQTPETVLGSTPFTNRNLSLSMDMQVNTDAMRRWHKKMMHHSGKHYNF